MRIAIVGVGGVGGFLAHRLVTAGADVVALARGAQLTAIRRAGLRLEGPADDSTVPLAAADDATALGRADVVVLAVKLYQVEEAVNNAAPLFGPSSLGISLMNGVDGADRASRVLGNAELVGGAAYLSAAIVAPGHVRYNGPMSSLVFGQPAGKAARTHAAEFAEVCRRGGVEVSEVEDVRGALWAKLIGMSSFSALTSAARLPAGPLMSDPEIVEVVRALIAEAAAVARASGVTLPDDVEATWLARFASFPPDLYASMYHDLARGARLEVEGLSGHVVREGRRLGVPTPHHAALFAVVKPHAAGKQLPT